MLAGQLGVPLPVSWADVANVVRLGKHLLAAPVAIDTDAIVHQGWKSDIAPLAAVVQKARQVKQSQADLGKQVDFSAYSVEWGAHRIAIAAHGTSWLRLFNGTYRQAVSTLRGVCIGKPPRELSSRLRLIDAFATVQRETRELAEQGQWISSLLGRLWRGVDSNFDEVDAVITWCREADIDSYLKAHARGVLAAGKNREGVAEQLERLDGLLHDVHSQLSESSELLKLDTQIAFGTDATEDVALRGWGDRLAQWMAAPAMLGHYLATDARVRKLYDAGLQELGREIEAGRVGPGEVTLRLDAIRCESTLTRAWHERPELAEFRGESFTKLRERFAALDQQRIQLSRMEVAKKHHDGLPVASADAGQVKVVRHEMNKKRKHLPLRSLLKQAGQAIQRIKPVFMMSPLSVAQYLAPGAVEFDLLVIDEASQVQPVDALGAIARSKQIVVVGDQRQLPPTNFFGRMSADDVDDEMDDEASVGDLESILGLCEAQGLPTRMLCWHYRSRHESLIAVSNRQFYDNRLFIVPSPLSSGGRLGLKLRYIADGWYDRGGSRVNRNEAVAVARAVMEHAARRPHLSLGVATFSSAQRDAIIDEVELRRRENPVLEEFFQLGGPAPFFVKSLENVQGDERDVIFISVGYGKDRDGYFAQNFGPLNKKGGERRLNVLISRASSACEVFTSLRADDIDLARTSSEGVAALKMYLNYAEHGHLKISQARGDADSLFEEQVAAALRREGLEVDHQIGVGGFYIDLAVRDADVGGRYLLGIECDGAQYHRARWVRDRDRLRQQILESRGWVMHRIWSTDWFQRPEEELRKVLAALADAKHHWSEMDQAAAEATTYYHSGSGADEVREDSGWSRLACDDVPMELSNPASPYIEATLSLSKEMSFGDFTQETLSAVVQHIVQVESPIHLDEVGRRCIAQLGQGRLTAAFKRKLTEAAQSLVRGGSIEFRSDFL